MNAFLINSGIKLHLFSILCQLPKYLMVDHSNWFDIDFRSSNSLKEHGEYPILLNASINYLHNIL